MPDEIEPVAELTADDLAKNLLTDAPEEPPADTKPAETTPEAPVEPEKVEEPPKEPEPEAATPQPGTPDKALQKMQQDLSATNRKIEDLMSKLDRGETLTAVEAQKVVESKRKIDQIRESMAAKNFDVFADGASESLAAATLETSDDVAQLKAELATIKQSLQQQSAEQTWKAEAAKYPGVNVQDVWKNALTEAAEVIGDDDPAKLNKLATKFYETRASAATKSVAAKTPAKTGNVKPVSPVTPGGAKVMLNSGTTAPVQSEDAVLVDSYLTLLKND